MAHLILQYSCELEKKYDFQDLANNLRKVMVETTLFPVGGIRVRALPTQINSIADGDSLNVYVDLVLRMGSGRTLRIGRDDNSSGNYMKGNVAVVMIYNRELTHAEMQQNYNAQRYRFGR